MVKFQTVTDENRKVSLGGGSAGHVTRDVHSGPGDGCPRANLAGSSPPLVGISSIPHLPSARTFNRFIKLSSTFFLQLGCPKIQGRLSTFPSFHYFPSSRDRGHQRYKRVILSFQAI